jgi:hypothetical protein
LNGTSIIGLALVNVVAEMVIGAIYYSPAFAGRTWMATIGKAPEDIKANNKPPLSIATAVLALFRRRCSPHAVTSRAGDVTLVGGALIGLLIWAGLALPVISNTFIFEGRKMTNHVTSSGCYLITLVVMGGIIGAWG